MKLDYSEQTQKNVIITDWQVAFKNTDQNTLLIKLFYDFFLLVE